MKTLLTIFTLVFTLMFSSTSFAGWTKVGENVEGDTFYVDFERIRKHDGFVYFWTLSDFFKPIDGVSSLKIYHQGDCKLFRFKVLSASTHKGPMGGGTGKVYSKPDKDWTHPPPNSSSEYILKPVCSR